MDTVLKPRESVFNACLIRMKRTEGIIMQAVDQLSIILMEATLLPENFVGNEDDPLLFTIQIKSAINSLDSIDENGLLDLRIDGADEELVLSFRKVQNGSIKNVVRVPINEFHGVGELLPLNFWAEDFADELRDKKITDGFVDFDLPTNVLLNLLDGETYFENSVTLEYMKNQPEKNAKSLIVSGANILSEFSYKIKISFIRNKCDGIGEQRLENIGGNYNRGCLIDALIPDTDVRIAFVGANNPIFLRYVLKNGTYASIAIAARLYKEEFKKHEDLVPKPSQRLEVEI